MDDHRVAVLIENLTSQFRTFGEGLQLLNEKTDQGFETLNHRLDNLEQTNRQEHMHLMQMIKELDREVQDQKLKRIK